METIKARVNPRLLSKAARLFTGTLAGRIIEVLVASGDAVEFGQPLFRIEPA